MNTEVIVFDILAAILIFAATRVVMASSLIRSVLWLGVVLVGTAMLFVVLGSGFLAGIQLLLYTGGVITLMLFGIMLTRRHSGLEVPNDSGRHFPAAALSLTLFAALAWAITATTFPEPTITTITAATIGKSFLQDHLIAFEVLSVLLLVVMIGAITLGRKSDFLAPTDDKPWLKQGAQ